MASPTRPARVRAPRVPVGLRFAALATLLLLSACGGDDAPAPTIGPAGGTVTGANGATIVVPPGALAQEVPIQITQIDPATANLPAGVERVGAVYAFTPRGTTFAVPVTVTLPFDPAQVPAGRSVQILKTTDAALTLWAAAAGSATSGNVVSAAFSSFTNGLPALVPGLPTSCTRAMARRVAMGLNFAAAVGSDGSVWTWGGNDDRQLGPGSTQGQDRLLPARVAGISNAVAVFPLFDGFAVLRADGRVLGWGNVFLRTAFETAVVDGVGLLDLTQVVQVAGGPAHTLALRADGTVWAWGSDLFGQLGNGAEGDTGQVVQVSALGGVSAIAAPGNASMAVRSDGSVWAWGQQGSDTCQGPGTAAFQLPQPVATAGAVAVVATGNHTLLWNPVGALSACGDGAIAGVFAGADTARSVSVPVVAAAVSGGYYDAAAAQVAPFILTIDAAGVLNGYSAPAAAAGGVNGTAGVCEVSAQLGSAVFVRSDGSVWAWGDNGHGQLGDGSRARRVVPVQVPGLNLN